MSLLAKDYQIESFTQDECGGFSISVDDKLVVRIVKGATGVFFDTRLLSLPEFIDPKLEDQLNNALKKMLRILTKQSDTLIIDEDNCLALQLLLKDQSLDFSQFKQLLAEHIDLAEMLLEVFDDGGNGINGDKGSVVQARMV